MVAFVVVILNDLLWSFNTPKPFLGIHNFDIPVPTVVVAWNNWMLFLIGDKPIKEALAMADSGISKALLVKMKSCVNLYSNEKNSFSNKQQIK